MDRTIASVAVRPVFIVRLKFHLLESFSPLQSGRRWMWHRRYYFVQFAGGNFYKLLVLLPPWEEKEMFLFKIIKKKNNFPSSCGKKRPSMISVGEVCVALFLFIRLFFPPLVYNAHEMGGGGAVYGIPLVVRWRVGRRKRVVWCQCSPSQLHWH